MFRGMRHSVLISASEAALLARLQGNEVHALWADSISAAIWAGDHVLAINTLELATPFPSHPLADVTRPRVRDITEEPQPSGVPIAAGDLGRIERVSICTTWVDFTPMHPVPETPILGGAVIPAGMGYDVITRSPTELTEESTGVVVDVAILFELSSGRHLAVSTDAMRIFIDTCIDAPLPDDLDACTVRTELSQRLG